MIIENSRNSFTDCRKYSAQTKILILISLNDWWSLVILMKNRKNSNSYLSLTNLLYVSWVFLNEKKSVIFLSKLYFVIALLFQFCLELLDFIIYNIFAKIHIHFFEWFRCEYWTNCKIIPLKGNRYLTEHERFK